MAAKGEPGVATTSASRSGTAQDELAEIEARCRWKGEAARWAASDFSEAWRGMMRCTWMQRWIRKWPGGQTG